MPLARLFSRLNQKKVNHLGEVGGPRSDQVDAELNNIVTFVNTLAAGAIRNIHRDVSVVGNIGAGLDTLHTFSLPAGSLASNGDYLCVKYGGSFANTANTKRIQISFDGQVGFDLGLFGIQARGWELNVCYIRVSETTIRKSHIVLFGDINRDITPTLTGNCSISGGNSLHTVANLNTNAVTLSVQGESGAGVNDDVIQNLSIIELCQSSGGGGGGGGTSNIVVRKNSGSDVGTRPRLNFIEGSGTTLTIADDSVDNEIDITIASSGGGGSYTDEQAQDAIGTILQDTSEIDLSYNDITPSISASVLAIAQSKITNLTTDLAAKAPTSRVLTANSPITGGGDLSTDRNFGFDQSIDLNNNARIAVRKNTGVDVGERRRLNFIEGSNITMTIADDVGNEEIDITVSSSGGGGGGNKGTAILNFGSTPSESASVSVIGQAGIVIGSSVKAYFMKESTVDNGVDEHEEAAALCPLVCGDIIVGTGFTIHAHPIAMLGVGTYQVRWEWA